MTSTPAHRAKPWAAIEAEMAREDETTMSKESFVSMFRSAADAIEFESQALSIGTEFLPEFALAVRAGGEPTEEYWTWLTEQFLSPGGHDFVEATETGALTES